MKFYVSCLIILHINDRFYNKKVVIHKITLPILQVKLFYGLGNHIKTFRCGFLKYLLTYLCKSKRHSLIFRIEMSVWSHESSSARALKGMQQTDKQMKKLRPAVTGGCLSHLMYDVLNVFAVEVLAYVCTYECSRT